MKKLIILVTFTALGIALPLAGAALAGRPLARYLQLSRDASPVAPSSFEWPAFLLYALVILAVLGPFVWRMASIHLPRTTMARRRHVFPWWGWAGFAVMVLVWVLAWSRIPAFAPFQSYTFTPLWVGYILLVNALVFRETGHCLLRDRPLCFLALFPTSALFWWYFEYLNRFAGNWYYVSAGFVPPLEYVLHASLSFSTVLPAVVGTRDWFATFSRPQTAFTRFWSIRLADAPMLHWALLIAGVLGFIALGVWPQHLYSMVWLAPLLLLVSLLAIGRLPHPLADIARGDWRSVVLPAFAALLTGFFWEMWNWNSLIRWEYAIPYVDRFLLFEMPILGYAGYLPFGIVCVLIAGLVCTDRNASG